MRDNLSNEPKFKGHLVDKNLSFFKWGCRLQNKDKRHVEKVPMMLFNSLQKLSSVLVRVLVCGLDWEMSWFLLCVLLNSHILCIVFFQHYFLSYVFHQSLSYWDKMKGLDSTPLLINRMSCILPFQNLARLVWLMKQLIQSLIQRK